MIIYKCHNCGTILYEYRVNTRNFVGILGIDILPNFCDKCGAELKQNIKIKVKFF